MTAAETTAGPSALATQARTVPFRASVASPASAACTNPTPASRHIAAARAHRGFRRVPEVHEDAADAAGGVRTDDGGGTRAHVRRGGGVDGDSEVGGAVGKEREDEGRERGDDGGAGGVGFGFGAGAGGARPAGRRGGSGSLELLHGARGGECFVRAAMVAETNGGFALGDERGGGGGGVGGAFDPDRGARGGRGRGGERFGDGGVQGVRAREGGVDRAVALADGEPRDVHVVGRANAGRDGLRQRARAVRDEERDARETVARAGGRRARRGGRESRARSRDERRLRGVEARKRNRQGGYAGEEKEASTTTREE